MDSASLHIEVSRQADWTVVKVDGEIDLATVEQLESAVDQALRSGATQLVIDLTGVTFLDSTGLRALLQTHGRMSDLGGSLALVLNGGPVERLLDIAGVAGTFAVYPSLEAVTN
ncbi:MAG TPA: STAS domain-containing protein [Acidimicrobiia bacterium]|nr:STAS domain-containing protein [Acidimicrobiia bacterium]